MVYVTVGSGGTITLPQSSLNSLGVVEGDYIMLGNTANSIHLTKYWLYDNLEKNFRFTKDGQISSNGKWKAVYLSGGYIEIGNGKISMSPPAGEILRSTLIQTTKQFSDFKLSFDVICDKQVITPSEPWHCGWLLFRHLDRFRHYYIAVKTNGIELGKKDAPSSISNQNDIERYQRFLFTSQDLRTAVGKKRKITLECRGTIIKLSVDDQLIKEINDNGTLRDGQGTIQKSSFTSGCVSPYSEGAQVEFSNIVIEPYK